MAIHIHYNVDQIQQAMRHATKEALLYMITEAPDNDGNVPAPRGFIRHSDGHLTQDYSSSEYDKALESLKQYVLHASYIIDAWRGKPKGSAMEVIAEGLKAQEYQYEALAYLAKGLAKTIKSNGLVFEYYLSDPSNIQSGTGYPDFHETGWVSAESTMRAIELSTNPDEHTMSIVDAAIHMATHE